MGSGTYERQGSYLSTGASGGYTFVRFPNGERWHDGGNPDVSDGYAELYYQTGFYVNAGNFYGSTFTFDGTGGGKQDSVYGPDVYGLSEGTQYVGWNSSIHFWESAHYNSYSSGYHESVADFWWSPTLPTYTISYSVGDGASGAPASQTKEYGTSITLSSDVPAKTNYKFMGWTDGNRTYQPGGQYSRNIGATLTAIWELDFVPPTAVLEAHRTTDATTDSDDPNGEHGYATVVWSCDQTKGANNIQSIVAVESNGTEVTFDKTPSGTNGTTIMHWPLAANASCTLTVTVTDTNNVSTVKTIALGTVYRAFQAIYDDANQRKYFKMSELELATPLGWAHGGTGGQIAVLFDDPTHELYGTYTLSESIVGYDMLEIVAVDNDGNFLPSVKVLNPAVGTRFTVLGAYIDTNYFWLKGATYEFNSGTVINTAYGIGWMRAQVDPINNVWEARDLVKIVRILGYKS